MFKQETEKNFKDAETIIGPSVMVKGNLSSNGNIVIEGILKGGVKTTGNVYIGDNAQIAADLSAKSARIGGEVKGNVKIEDGLQIVSSAKIFGDIECASLSVENGAVINGKCMMTKDYQPEKQEAEATEE